MKQILFELKEEEAKRIYGGEEQLVYVLNDEGKCIPRYINT